MSSDSMISPQEVASRAIKILSSTEATNENFHLSLPVGTAGIVSGQLESQRGYFEQLRQDINGMQSSVWTIKQMKTKWGIYNILAKRIWINLKLAEKTGGLLRKYHRPLIGTPLDKALLQQLQCFDCIYFPYWQVRKDVLKRSPLSYEEWEY